MKQFKSTLANKGPNPTPDQCIMEMINRQLKVRPIIGVILHHLFCGLMGFLTTEKMYFLHFSL